jgi:hypothetical protein
MTITATTEPGLVKRLGRLELGGRRRLLDDNHREHHIDGSSDTLGQIESKLREYLTPDEQQRSGDSNREASPANGQA